jgi:hypothetical protein
MQGEGSQRDAILEGSVTDGLKGAGERELYLGELQASRKGTISNFREASRESDLGERGTAECAVADAGEACRQAYRDERRAALEGVVADAGERGRECELGQ